MNHLLYALATTKRILRQIGHDHRTLGLIFVVPSLLMTLLKYLFDHSPETFNHIGGPLVGMFPFVMMFLITSIAVLRERNSGTLERLMSLPIAKLDLLLGYGLAFALLAAAQATVTSVVAFYLLGLETQGAVWTVILLAILNATLGMALGLFASAFAKSEFQAVQFMPAFVLPQILLCGIFIPRENMASGLRYLSDVLPFTYAYDALNKVTTQTCLASDITKDVAVVMGATLLALILGALTLRRQTG